MAWRKLREPLAVLVLNHSSQTSRILGGLLWASLGAAALGAPGCSESRPAIDVADTGGKRMCCVLAATCHDADASEGGQAGAGGASEEPMTSEQCHELGHDGDPDDCRAAYDHCLELCGVSDSDEAEAERGCK